ncbi:hypothetical protein ACFYO0_45465 [Streptomyces sp. NPDC006365]|uniref:hypothetical protein n=1 Tax=Streptomyces sp. NPDC006365 TaxID=3364744 RepID=UPI0036AFF5E8
MTVHDEVYLAVEVAYEPVEEAAHDVGVEGLGEDMKCMWPLVLIADIALTENRLPVRRTTASTSQPSAFDSLRRYLPR